MSSDTKHSQWKQVFTSPEWIWRHSVMLFLVANLWLDRNYVTRAQHQADQREVTVALTDLKRMIWDLQLNLELIKQNVERLNDHEVRLRSIEGKLKS